MIFCSYCGQGFKRDEHLERHVLIHTDIRPFRCQECKLTFKRKDLLRRHFRSIHAPPSELDSTQADDEFASSRNSATERISIACANCAASKTKCDNQAPCGRCVKKKLTCERRAVRRTGSKNSAGQQKIFVHPVQPLEAAFPTEVSEETDHDMKDPESGESSTSPLSSVSSIESGGDEQICQKNEPATDFNTAETMNFTEDIGACAEGVDVSSANEMQYPSFFDSIAHSMLHDIDLDTPMDEIPSNDYFTTNNQNLIPALDGNFADSLWSFPSGDIASMPLSFTATALPTAAPTPPVSDLGSQWPMFLCNPHAGGEEPIHASAFSTSLLNLKVLNNPSIWSSIPLLPDASQSDEGVMTSSSSKSTQIEAPSRDKLLAITQKLWAMAKESVALPRWRPDQRNDEANSWMDHVVLLPPVEVSQHFLQQHRSHGYQCFHMLPPAQEFASSNSAADADNTLLVGISALLIVAQSTRSSPVAELRALSSGLGEVCRIVMQDEDFTTTPDFLDASLSVLQLIQWSGDGWHMNALMKLWEQHAKIIRKNLFGPNQTCLGLEPLGLIETQIKMTYNWLAVDLELSIFHDTPPKLAIQEIPTPAISPSQFNSHFSSLAAMFESFTDGQLSSKNGCILTPAHLRLLLHPLQCLSAHLHQCLDTFGSIQNVGFRNLPSSNLGLASKAFIDELGIYLRRWHKLSATVGSVTSSGSADPIMQGSMALYHIMVLNNLTSFPDIERLTRDRQKGLSTGGSAMKPWMRTPSPESTALLLYHAGQCLAVLRGMLPPTRPLWWAAALYRATLVLCHVVTNNHTSSTRFSTSSPPPSSHPASGLIFLDQEYPHSSKGHDAPLQRFLGRLQGTPVLTRLDNSPMFLTSSADILEHAITLLNEHLIGDGTDFVRGILGKLCTLRARMWNDTHFQGQPTQSTILH
ncbi:hypothetical protein BKA66DRAFT_464379 [Pyrenochaeta sp. MPI-SDFR-AT-0127]|nr:hypothetical protein BKA66DRAFT_464379 [Pyrenochaeta sp. MPI-SDFR-AT-0127]